MARKNLLYLVLVLLPGCFAAKKRFRSPQSSPSINLFSEPSGQTLEAIKLQEAQLADIALPLSVVPLPDYFCAAPITVLGYRDTALSIEQAKEFFLQEMVRTGWLLKECWRGSQEILLRFKKPMRLCYISLRDSSRGITIVISTGFRQDLENQ